MKELHMTEIEAPADQFFRHLLRRKQPVLRFKNVTTLSSKMECSSMIHLLSMNLGFVARRQPPQTALKTA